MLDATYTIGVASRDDIAGIVDLQDANQADRGGALSVRFPPEWFETAMAAMPLIVARRDGTVVGYLVSSSLAAQAHVPIVQAMLRTYPAPPGAYMYGPICVARSERGHGLAARLFGALRAQLPGRDCLTFIRHDNGPSRRAHAKMGMREVAEFTHAGATHVVVAYAGSPPQAGGE